MAEKAQRAATLHLLVTNFEIKTIKYRNAMHILTTQPNTETPCKYTQHNQIHKLPANTNNTTKYRNALQTLTTQPSTETPCKYTQHNQIHKLPANTHNTNKIQKRSANTHNTTKYRNVLQILATQPDTEMCYKYNKEECGSIFGSFNCDDFVMISTNYFIRTIENI